MKSLRNHLSLVVALLSILFSLQTFIIVDRSINAYKDNLSNNYSLVVVSQKTLNANIIINQHKLIKGIVLLSPDKVIKRLNHGISKKNIDLLKLSLPKFYKLVLVHYPSPIEVNNLTKALLRDTRVIKVETFSKSHDTTYKLLLLFKTVISVFAFSVGIVTILLISKELKIWQFKHTERMSIMGLFGAPIWLSSAVLFRLAFVDALIASAFAFVIFSYVRSSDWLEEQLSNIGITVVVFDPMFDFGIMLGVALLLSTLLATFIVISHKEEV
ncbi:MAG: cell division protein FtsX [Sulfurimonas sp.]|nr:MAG: cell division protein FtsX [Sulfurimonas sp.]PHQ58227.1 MAG: cell division protein FtsX [Sulfurimonas sp.]